MFLLLTGASGVGKTTVRRLVQDTFTRVLDAVELSELAGLRDVRPGRRYLLCGDPASPAELLDTLAARSAGGLAVCLLDASEDAHRRRLFLRGDDADAMARHVAEASWLRARVVDTHWPARWSTHVVDTSELRDYEVAARVSEWIRRVIGFRARLRVARR